MSKHFTDAELMAEYWCEFAEHLWWDPKRGRLHTEQVHLHKQAEERAETILRFANAPHYTEDN